MRLCSTYKIHPIVMGTKIFDKGMMTYQYDYGVSYTIPSTAGTLKEAAGRFSWIQASCVPFSRKSGKGISASGFYLWKGAGQMGNQA